MLSVVSRRPPLSCLTSWGQLCGGAAGLVLAAPSPRALAKGRGAGTVTARGALSAELPVEGFTNLTAAWEAVLLSLTLFYM